jgi:pseudomonalisin
MKPAVVTAHRRLGKTLVASAGSLALVLGLGYSAVPTAQAATTAWAVTHTKALPMSNAKRLGEVPARKKLQVSVVLSVRHPSELAHLAQATSTPGSRAFGHFLTPRQVAARFAPSSASAAAVAGYLSHEGFSHVRVESDRLFVDATGTVRSAEKAFHTKLSYFSFTGHKVFANTAPALVPSRFGGRVLAVLGLSDVRMNLPHVLRKSGAKLPLLVRQQIAKLSATGTPDLSGFTESQLAKIYDASRLSSGGRTAVAVVASGDMAPTIADLRYAEAQYHAPRVPVSVVYDGPKAAVVEHNPFTGNLEWNLDTQMSTLIAGRVSREYIYDIATLDDADVARAINLFVEQDRARAGSASLGECDIQPWLDGSLIATDEVLAEGALQGQSFFASSGDNGYACPEVASTGVPGGVPGTSWPADGTWTTGVGGTSVLATSSGQYMEELSWIGGGGGISNVETPGNWTQIANPASAGVEYLPAGGRGVPDIAADADPNVSPVIVWQNKAKSYVGGTSVASPLCLGLWARMETIYNNKLGLASLDFYRIYNEKNKAGSAPVDPAGFNDIELGSNGLYTALPGYDFTTGIGSLKAAVLVKELK